MKQFNIIIVVLIVIGLAGLGLIMLLKPAEQPGENTQQQGGENTFPTTGGVTSTSTTGATIAVPLAAGGTIEVKNFLTMPTTSQDPHNKGYYFLGNQPSDTTVTPYLITFIAQTGFFNIGIFKQPIGTTRKAAEAYLRAQTGMTDEQLCALKYTVATPAFVDGRFGGEDLRFSFCKDAIVLQGD